MTLRRGRLSGDRAGGPAESPCIRRDFAHSHEIRRSFDLVIVVAFGLVGFLIRRRGLPTDGLWLDDAWVALGAIHGRLSDLFTVGSASPGFTALLMAWHSVSGTSLRSLAFPTLVVGTAGPPLLYLGLGKLGYERSVRALLAAALVVSKVDVQQSARVKPYMFDVAAVLLLAVAVPRLAQVTWRWPTALMWVIAVGVLSSISGYVLVSSAAAGVILVLHSAPSDRLTRLVAVMIQATAQGLAFLAEKRSSDLAGIERFMQQAYNGHLTFHSNPRAFSAEVMVHLQRIADVYPGGSGTWLKLFALVAIAGLVIASIQGRRRTEALAARFLLLLVVFAFVGALFGRFPFGPTTRGPLDSASSGGRHTLWLVPALAVGLAAVAHRVRRLVRAHHRARFAFDSVLVLAALVVVVNGYGQLAPYPNPGSASATHLIESEVRPSDVVILAGDRIYSYAVSSRMSMTLRPTPNHQIGFTPVFHDKRFHSFGEWSELSGTPAQIRAAVRGADRVLVYGGIFGSAAVERVTDTLRASGFQNDKVVRFHNDVVLTWLR